MHLRSLATATPPHSFTQRECWDHVKQTQERLQLKDRSLALLQRVLLNDNGIRKRHLALNDLERIFDYTSDELAVAFEREAPALASLALTEALDRGGILASEVDALFICTCTGYLCPGLTSHVAQQIGLRSDTYLHDAAGNGCGAAIPTMRAAHHFLVANPTAVAACVAVEICSAAFYLDDDPGVLISACLFGDGAAATLWTGGVHEDLPRAFDFATLHRPEWRDLLRFETRHGKLRNRLHKSVPANAARAVSELFGQRGERSVAGIVSHPGGRDVLLALESQLPGYDLNPSWEVLREFGNMSSPSVLFALEKQLAKEPLRDDLWLVSFGAGFSCHSCRIGRVAS